ncbi:hypothetical protein GXW82_24585 [Streptacidiphilus sp. 4-A2]|nr:hypothetical protein [Streptacidiphilus sp. 4-A2]
MVELTPVGGESKAELAQKKLLHKHYRVTEQHHLSLVDVSLLVRNG